MAEAHKLVEAAEAAIDQHHKAHLGEARAVVVAVLRELDRWYWEHDSDMAQLDAGVLADEIEGGA